ELSDAAQSIFDTMRADFQSIAPPALAGVPISGAEAEYPDPKRVLRDMKNDSFSLPIYSPANASTQRVRYYVDRRNSHERIIRETSSLDSIESPAVETALYPQVNVAQLRCEFAAHTENGLEWVLGWDRPEPPAAVRISMTLENPEFPYIQVS